MGRPLNKKWFTGSNSLNLKLECTVRIGGTNYVTSIVRQRSNSKYEVYGGVGSTQTGTSLAFADADPDTITDGGADFADFTTVFTAGEYVIIGSAEDAANNGIYLIGTVAADVITLDASESLVANTADTTATLTPASGSTVVASLVQGAPTVNNTMQITITVDGVGTESVKILNAHQVKTFEGNTYVWNDLGATGGSRAQFLEGDLQGT